MDDTTRKALADNVRSLRDHHGWSQTELAKRSGVKQTTISALERGVHAATIDTITNLAVALRVTPWSLLMPGIPPTNHRAGAARLMDIYVHLPEAGQEQVDRVAEAESRYHRIKP
jgi:transcriptional regulator with XRE-family HTH domain